MSASGGWWEPELRTKLSQGDILADVPFAFFRPPLTHVKQMAVKNHPIAWIPHPRSQCLSKDTQTYFALAGCEISHGLVVSHDCAIDKKDGKVRVLTAPVTSIKVLQEKDQKTVRAQGHFSLLYLTDVPDVGECFADLKVMSPIDRDLIDASPRVVSMTDAGRERLAAQIMTFFVDRAG